MKDKFDFSGLMDLQGLDSDGKAPSDPPSQGVQKIVSRKQHRTERQKEIAKDYNRRIKELASIKTDILKGMREGQDIERLFLKAVKGIAVTTCDETFYNQIAADLEVIYGVVLEEKGVEKIQLEKAKERLAKLEDYMTLNDVTADGEHRIKEAITAHKKEILELKEKLSA